MNKQLYESDATFGVIHDGPNGGYKWALPQWREYYSVNVRGLGALSHEQFVKEFPKVAEALAASQDKVAAQVREAEEAKRVADLLAGIPRDKLVAALRETMTTADAPQVMQMHSHTFNDGDEETGETNGHTHKVQNGGVMDCEGHTHDMAGLTKGG